MYTTIKNIITAPTHIYPVKWTDVFHWMNVYVSGVCGGREQGNRSFLVRALVPALFFFLLFFILVPTANAAQVTLSGTLYSDEGVTQITTQKKPITVIVGTSTISTYSTTTNSGSGVWHVNIPSGNTIGTSTPLLIFVDGDPSIKASLFTKASSTASITNLDLYQNRVIISHEGATTSTSTRIVDMAFYDNDNDSDIQFNASSTAGTLTIQAGNELHIKDGKSFTPGGAVTVNGNAGSGTDGSFHLPGTATYTSAYTTSIAGHLYASTTATLTNTSTLTMTATTSGKTLSVPPAPIGNITFSGNNGAWSFMTNATATSLTINAGATVVAPAQGNISISGDYTNNGTFTATTSTTTFNGTMVQTATGTMTGTSAFKNLSFVGGGVKTFSTNVSTTNYFVSTGSTVIVPEQLLVAGNYQNNGTTTYKGAVWKDQVDVVSRGYNAITYGNGLFVAVASWDSPMYLSTSPDGISWTARSVPVYSLHDVTYGNGRFVAVGGDGVAMYSFDGSTWATTTIPESNYWMSVTYGNGLFVAVSYDGINRVMTSPDGISWTIRSVTDDVQWTSVTYGNGLFVAVANDLEYFMTSLNGADWVRRSHNVIQNGIFYNDVTYGNGLFVAVGDGSGEGDGTRIIVSVNGIVWTAVDAPEANNWTSVTYGNGLFVAVSNNGINRVMTSPNGTSWTPYVASEQETWTSVAYGGNKFVAMSYYGTVPVMTSIVGTTTFNGTTSQSIGGILSGASAMGNVVFQNGTTTTFTANASTSNFIVNENAIAVAPASITIYGDYSNSGTTTHSGMVTLSGTTKQTLSGSLTGTSAFSNLTLTNVSKNGSTTERAVVFESPASTTGTFTMRPGSSAQLLAGATSTFTHLTLTGSTTGSSTQYVYLRSTASGTQATINVSGTQSITYTDVMDNNACPTILNVADGTSVDGGNNTCWTFIGSYISSAAHQVFSYGQATTPMETITIGDSGTITTGNDIRIRIATTTIPMLWDTTDTTAILGGSASGKVSTTVSYEDGGATLVINVTSNFSEGDTVTVSGLSYTQFTGVHAPAYALRLYTGGASDTTADDTDDKTIVIYGTLTLDDHSEGQTGDNFESSAETNIPLYRFSLSSLGEDSTVSSLTVRIPGSMGIDQSDLSNFALYRDNDRDGTQSGGDKQVGGTPTISLTQSGTITFTTPFSATTTDADYVLMGTAINLRAADSLVLTVLDSDVSATGNTTGGAIVPHITLTLLQHMKGGGGGGSNGGAVGGPSPAGDGVRTGGGSGGGGATDPNSGDTIGSEVGFRAPSSQSGSWSAGANAYSSDGVYTTTSSNNIEHVYSQFIFTVPASNAIAGIEVKLEAHASTNAGSISARLSWDGGSTFTDLRTTPTLSTTDAVYTLGSPSDTWGRSWTPAETGNGTFTLMLLSNTGGETINLDATQVKIYHQAVGGGGGGGGAVYHYSPLQYASVYETGWSIGGLIERFIEWLKGIGNR